MLAVIIAVSVFTVVIPGIASESSNTPATTEQTEEIGIEELQQWIHEQGYNYTVAKNWITYLSSEERKALCGYKHLKAPTEPLPENVGFVSDVPKEETKIVSLPSSYDAMALGYVTPIKNQICGACWLHGAIADFESDVAIGESNLLDFSEQEVGDCNIWASEGGHNYCNGGNAFMTTNYFTKKGAADETCHPYAAAPQTCQNCPILKNVDNWRMITGSDGESQITTIKDAILNYGPVYSTIYASDPAFSAYDSGVYEYWGTGETDHAIEIIGWDNTLSHSHGNGAWLIKNSWGTGWGASGPYPGCAWVAYGAANLGDATSAISGYSNADSQTYFHDECGWMWYSVGYYPSTTAYGAVRFIPSEDSTLTAVDFWTVDIDMQYEIKVFDTISGGPPYTFSNQLGTTQTGSTAEMGYYSIPLDTPIPLVSGDDFIVQVKLTTTGWGYPIPIDYCTYSWLNWSTIATSSGESYLSCDGSQFDKYGTSGKDIGIRARTEVEITQPDIWVSPQSFEKESSPDEVYSENLIIGNSGTGALNFEIQIVEQQTTSAKTTIFNAIEDTNSDNIGKAGNGTGIAFVKCDKNCKLVSLPSNSSGDLLSQIIVVNDTYTLKPSEDSTVTDTPSNTKLYLRGSTFYLSEYSGSTCYEAIFEYIDQYGIWDDYFLTGDISGTKYDYCLYLASAGTTTFKIEFIIDGNTVATDTITVPDDPYYQQFCGTITGSDPTTSDGDGVKVKIKPLSGSVGGIIWGDGSGCDSYITIPSETSNTPPTACFTVSPPSGYLDTIFSFDASCSSDAQDPASALQVRWDWKNDGVYDTSYTTTKTATHQYTSAGTKTIKLQVRDTGGLTNTTTKSVIVSEEVGWLSVSPTIGTVNPGSQTNLNVIFNTTGLNVSEYYANITITSNDPDENPVIIPVHLTVGEIKPFDTDLPENPYPSIMGTHNGTITPNQTINVSKMYTYPCTGTGGHSEYVAFYNATTEAEIANGTWKSYQGAGDYHYIEFNVPFTLQENETYNYTIRTGSYPQIFHTDALQTANGWINCTKFTDANGKEYTDWIPAIRLE